MKKVPWLKWAKKMRLQDISKGGAKKWRKCNINSWRKVINIKYCTRCNFMQMSSTTQINCFHLDIRIKLLEI
jgi:hypothetical protein